MVESLSETLGISKVQATNFVSTFLDMITGALSNSERVVFPGFGTFYPKVRKAREGRNPRTGETIQIPETTVAAFKPGKAMSEAVAEATEA